MRVHSDRHVFPEAAPRCLLKERQTEDRSEQTAVTEAGNVVQNGAFYQTDDGLRGGNGLEENRGGGGGHYGPSDVVMNMFQPCSRTVGRSEKLLHQVELVRNI